MHVIESKIDEGDKTRFKPGTRLLNHVTVAVVYRIVT
jgi:hypothetical protein